MATTPLFSWRCAKGPVQQSDHLPHPEEPVIELTLHRHPARMKADGHRAHEGHPVHEAAMRSALPTTLQILRLDGCRLRTWPQKLPLGLHELYASQCDFFTFPDLSAYTNLIVIEMPDNRVESLTAPLPPVLARLNLDYNALREVRCAKPATLANAQFHNNPGLEQRLRDEDRDYAAAVRRAMAAQPPMPPPLRRPSAVPDWVAATAAPRIRVNRIAFGTIAVGLEPAREVNPYKNDHNVHDSGIQDSTKANLTYLANYKPDVPPNKRLIEDIKAHLNTKKSTLSRLIPVFCHSIAADMGLTSLDISKAQGFSGPVVAKVVEELRIRIAQPYVMHGVMPAEIVDRLWLRIMDFEGEVRDELVKRFCDEIIDAAAHCTNGFMVRMANVLIGYDENCVMKMRPTQIMQARVPATMARLRKKLSLAEGATEPWEFWRDCVLQTWEDMEEIDMEHKERSSWLTDLIYPLLPELCKGIPKSMRGEPAPEGEGGDMVSYLLRNAIEEAKLNKPAKRVVPDREELDLATYVRNEAMGYLPGKWRGDPDTTPDLIQFQPQNQ